MVRSIALISFTVFVVLCSCNKSDVGPIASYEISGRHWTTDYVNVNVYNGFIFLRLSAENEFGVVNQMYLKVNGTVEGVYDMNQDLSESMGYMNSNFTQIDPVFYSVNTYFPDTVKNAQFLTIRSIDWNSQKMSLDFDLHVINQSTGQSERVKGNIRNALYTSDPKIKHNIVELSDGSCFMGVLQSYDGYNMYFVDDNFGYVRLALPANLTQGTHDVESLQGVLYDQYFIVFNFKLSGTVTILERNPATGSVKGLYKLVLTYNDGSKNFREGYFSAART